MYVQKSPRILYIYIYIYTYIHTYIETVCSKHDHQYRRKRHRKFLHKHTKKKYGIEPKVSCFCVQTNRIFFLKNQKSREKKTYGA